MKLGWRKEPTYHYLNTGEKLYQTFLLTLSAHVQRELLYLSVCYCNSFLLKKGDFVKMPRSQKHILCYMHSSDCFIEALLIKDT